MSFKFTRGKQVGAILLLALYSTALCTPLVHALGPEQTDIYKNGIRYFNYQLDNSNSACGTDLGGNVDPASSCAGLVGKTPEERIFNALKAKGFSSLAAIAIIGNMQQESSLDSTAVNASSGATGIVQWLGSRLTALKSYANKNDQNYKKLCIQLDFLYYEISEGDEKGRDVIGKMKTAETEMKGKDPLVILDKLTEVWDDVFERNGGGSTPQRQDNARESYTRLIDGKDTATNGNVGCANLGDLSGIVGTAIGLAWPEPFRDANPREAGRNSATSPTKAYVAAVAQYNSAHSGFASIDCGVFVATVMIASGADKQYPTGYTTAQYDYVTSHPEKYQIIHNPKLSDLQPGDIMVITKAQRGPGAGAGHTWIYVGPQPGGYTVASASLGTRAPNLGYPEIEGYTLARLIGS